MANREVSVLAICDWLDITQSPDDHSHSDVTDVLQSANFCLHEPSQKSVAGTLRWSSPAGGVVQLSITGTFSRISASGSAIGYLRDHGLFADYLSAIALRPFKITRLDAAHDVMADAAPVIQAFWKKHPVSCPLVRKAVKTKLFSSARFLDEIETGTVYIGKRRSGSTTAKMYDKREQIHSAYGRDCGYHWLRYEVTVQGAYAVSLRDCFDPTALFWHIASPMLLPLAAGVPVWNPAPTASSGWNHVMTKKLPYDVLKSRLEFSADFRELVVLAHRTGPNWRTTFERLMSDYLDSVPFDDKAPVSPSKLSTMPLPTPSIPNWRLVARAMDKAALDAETDLTSA